MENFNKHHLLYTRGEWCSTKESKILRREHALIPLVDKDAHTELHANCPAVPLLGKFALRLILEQFEPQRNTILTLDNLMRCIDEVYTRPIFNNIERDIGYTAFECLDMQKSYLIGNIIREE